ncbi:transcriptional regulator BetI [compost metagenome]
MKHPELTRAALLGAARRVLRTHGATLSLDAVAREAGISKGGLLHHYPSKDSLLSALAHALIEQFQDDLKAALADEVAQHGHSPGAWLRAYIELSFKQDEELQALGVALAPLAALPDMSSRLQNAQHFIIGESEADGIPIGRAHAIRLACDGLWLGDYAGMPKLDEAQRTALKAELLAWTRR